MKQIKHEHVTSYMATVSTKKPPHPLIYFHPVSLIKNINLVKKKNNLFVAFSLSETIFKPFPIKLLQLHMFSRKEQLLKES